MRAIWQDLRFGLRIWHHSPGFAVAAVLTLAAGIAMNATVFSWIDSVLLHPLPGVGDARNLALLETVSSGGEHLVNTSFIDCRDYERDLRLVSALAFGRFTPLSVGAEGKTGRAWAELVSANYFDVLEVRPVLGRGFRAEEAQRPGSEPVAVISYKMWRDRFSGDPKVLGEVIRLNRRDLTIIGVAPAGFHGSMVGVVYDVWIPITMAGAMGTGSGTLNDRGTRDITSTFVRLKRGVGLKQGRDEVAALARRLAAAHPDTNRGIEATLVPVWAGHLGAQGLLLKPLAILMAMAVLLLLMACANVANLFLARAVSRRKEFALRLALGAGRSRLAGQLFTETLLIACAGGAAGLVLMAWMGPVLQYLFPPMDIPIDLGGGLNLATAGFTLLIVAAAMLLSGTAPALFSVQADVNSALKEGGRGGSSDGGSHGWRRLLATIQVALAMVALTGAGLFSRSFRGIMGIQPGFDMDRVSVSQFYLSSAGYSAVEQHQFCRELRRRMEAQPGMLGVTYSDVVPLGSPAGSSPWHRLAIDGYVPGWDEQVIVHRATVPPGYFEFMKIRLSAGRDFSEDDSKDKPMAMIVNQAFAARYFRGRSVVGRKVMVEGTPATVVGLAQDSKYDTLAEGPTPYFYVPFQQCFAPGLNFAVFVRAAGDPLRFTPLLRREALALNQDAVFHTRLLADAATASLYPQRVAANLLAVVGGACLLLAAIGLYSVMSYTVSQRTRELGIRVALGARPANIRWIVLREGLLLTLPGLAAGFGAAVLAARLVSGMLVTVGAVDPAAFGAAALFVAGVALAASYLPASRATRVDPMQVLNRE
ncbi:MAG: ABC transporter permease [Bryobacteraceae bacterium]